MHVGTASVVAGADITTLDFESPFVDICGFLIGVQETAQNPAAGGTPVHQDFFPETAHANLAAVTLAVCKGNPILLSGPTGSGKTHTILELAKRTNNAGGLIKIHLGDQSDAKVLLGSYVCTDVPGEFRWVSGALTKAVTEGRWVVIEDIDLAPTDVLSVLIPLLQKRRLFIASRGEDIPAAPGFQLFATQTSSTDGSAARTSAAGQLLGGFWTRVRVEPLPYSELEQIVRHSFPHLAVLAPRFLHTFKVLVTLRDGAAAEVAALVEGASAVPELSQLRVGRFVSTRDLMKWCRRVVGLIGDDATQETMHKHISSRIRELCFLEAVDCFAGAIRHDALRNFVSQVIARCWELGDERASTLLHHERPQVTESPSAFRVGRASLIVDAVAAKAASPSSAVFAYTRMSLELMEKIAQCISHEEPVLLVGETGAGKTSTIQHLARRVGSKLVVLNMNQQSDSADLLGGFRPVELRLLCYPLKLQFETLFCKTFSKSKNKAFLDRVEQAFAAQNWAAMITLFTKACQLAESKFAERNQGNKEIIAANEAAETGVRPAKQRKVAEGQTPSYPSLPAPSENEIEWNSFKSSVLKFEHQHRQLKNAFAFSFVEGALVRAVQDGSWVLLDEINLASQETLESLSGLLDGDSLVLSERGDVEPVVRHLSFRLLACMNPATDVGKKDLPPALRNRFSEFVLREMTQPDDLTLLVSSYLKGLTPNPPVAEIVQFFLAARQEAETSLSDGANQRPHFSLRTLARALDYTRDTNNAFGNFERALVEGLSTSFLTQLDSKSYLAMRALIKKHVLTKTSLTEKMLERAPRSPGDKYVQFEQFWLELGPLDPFVDPHYILTPSIKQHLVDLGRILTSRKYPVLIQGPTSAGKTSMIEFLARRTGHRFVRINNHEHTDIQEYIGQYVSDPQGRLIFQEGILVEAVRNGYWVVLDELNLAPSEVLEALNRLLDDNRELFIPETQQIVKPHPHFMLFATQNPPGLYGGRKNLSRAFRNRFIELHFDEIPDSELETILRERCYLPQSYCKHLIAIMKDLQRQRQGSQVFAGRHGLITLRDLFRWAERQPRDYQELATHGYMLLADRLRDSAEQSIVKQTLEKHLRVELDVDLIYETEFRRFVSSLERTGAGGALSQLVKRVVWTKSAKRIFALVYSCLRFSEPVLLVGETGTGKTTVCQVLAELLGQTLHILNCHQHTETADFLGGLRPVRGKDVVAQRLRDNVAVLFGALSQNSAQLGIDLTNLPRSVETLNELSVSDVVAAFEEARSRLHQALNSLREMDQITRLSVGHMQALCASIEKVAGEFKSLFQWYDGPLVHSMRRGDIFLVDEISLAEDAVLERLNSILEPSRTLTLAEKGGAAIEELHSHPDFRILATMNPGGDFGKKELSPALRNRFTEVWVPAISSRSDLKQILDERFANPFLAQLSDSILDFIDFFNSKQYGASKNSFSLRDVLAWVDFIKLSHTNLGSPQAALIHGAHMILLDGLGITHPLSAEHLKKDCLGYLLKLLAPEDSGQLAAIAALDRIVMDPAQMHQVGLQWTDSASHFGIGPFVVEKASGAAKRVQTTQFTFRAPTTSSNLVRLLRGLQLPKPLLLEGSPGVGKTSLVEALGALCGRKVVRINLSEQTDMLDLLGADLPQEDDNPSAEPSFAWRDGIFLDALRAGDWVLLDEMNLANQSVLEGLNAVLDHRGSVFIPELNRTFVCPPSFRIFACQNPTQQGGGRKGLPKSFLNRFTKVYLDQFTSSDLHFVATTIFPSIPAATVAGMVKFNQELAVETMEKFLYARLGSPWEFNLRDILRWCQLVASIPCSQPGDFVDMLYLQRLRTSDDRRHVQKLYLRVFGEPLLVESRPFYSVDPYAFQVGSAVLSRAVHADGATIADSQLELFHSHLPILESLMRCVKLNWLPIILGSSAIGKSAIVQLLADLSGHQLHVFSLNSSVDTIELLGGFEQVDLKRHREELVKEIHSFVYNLLRTSFIANNQGAEVARISQLFITFCAAVGGATASQQAFSEDQERLVRNLLAAAGAVAHSEEHSSRLSDLHAQVARIQAMNSRSSTGCFEWADGILVKALKKGDWILMDNVNLCANPVLDRLLPLLEPNGYLLLNERGIINGEIPKIVPHPNFRIFFTMDPKNGEISRAMRNRGIELVLISETSHETTPPQDYERVLLQRGFAASEAKDLAQTHHMLAPRQSSNAPAMPLRDLVSWAELARELQQRGHDAQTARLVALETFGYRGQGETVIHKPEFAEYLSNFISEPASAQPASLALPIASESARKAEAQLLRAFSATSESSNSVSILRIAIVCLSRIGPQRWRPFLASASNLMASVTPDSSVQGLLSTFLSALHDSPAVQRLQATRVSPSHPLSEWFQASPESLQLAATDLSLNEPFLHQLKRSSMELSERNLLQRLPAIFSFAMIHALESTSAEAVRESSVAASAQSPMQQAVAYSLGKLAARSLHHPLVALIPSILETIDASLLAVIASEERVTDDDEFANLSILLAWRLLWSLHCQAPKEHFNPVLLILLLRWAKKSILKLTTGTANVKLESVVSHSQSTVWQSSSIVSSHGWSFWRNLGHPVVLGKKDLSEIAVSFRPLLRQMEFDLSDPTIKSFGSQDSRSTILDALATLYWAQISSQELPQRDAVLSVLRLLPAQLQEEWKQSQVSRLSDMDPSRVSNLTLWELEALAQERGLVASLSQLVVESRSGTSRVPVDLVERLKRFVFTFGTKAVSRSPVDFIPYKVLLWIADSDAQETASLAGLVQEAAVRHLLRPSRSVLALKPPTSTGESETSEMALSRFDVSIRDPLLFSLANSWASVSVADREAKLEILGDTVSLLADHKAASFVDPDWVTLKMVFADTLLALAPTSGGDLGAISESIVSDSRNIDVHRLRAILAGELNLSSDCVDHSCNVATALMQYNSSDYSARASLDGWRRRGDALASLGFLRALLAVPAEPIDPCMKNQVLFEAIGDIVGQLEMQQDLYVHDEAIATGRSTNQRVRQSQLAIDIGLQMRAKAEAGVVLRPESVPLQTFRALYDESHQLFADGGLCSAARLRSIILSLQGVNLLRSENLQALAEESAWQNTVTQLLVAVVKKYPDFVDVSGPLIASVRLIQRGIRVSRIAAELQAPVEGHFTLYDGCLHLHSVADLLLRLIPNKLLSETASQAASLILSPLTSGALSALVKLASPKSKNAQTVEVLRLHSSLLRACLKRLVHIGIASGSRSSATHPVMASLSKIFDMFSQTYKKMREDDARREQEEAMAFKYKTKSVNIETKEELDEKIHNVDFPNYFREFNAIIGEVPAADPHAPAENQPADADAMDQDAPAGKEKQDAALSDAGITYRFSEEESYDICRAHWVLYSVWNKADSAKVLAVSSPSENALHFQQAYSVVSDIYSLLADRAPAPVTAAVLNVAHTLRLRSIVKEGTALPSDSPPEVPHFSGASLWSSATLPSNFYSAPNPAEVNLILDPVKMAQAKIQSLLNEPEIGQNEVLLMLNRILQRLVDLQLSAPLMQFMTGAEVFLRKAQDWELYQPARYSMRDELERILRVVSRWRRLELEFWPRILDQKRQQAVAKSSHWWFYLYGVVCDSREPLEEIQKSLQTFIETSSYGEYQPRLAMLLAFYHQTCFNISQSLSTEDLSRTIGLRNLLFNLFKYYEQWTANLEAEMADLTKPIQEKLQDFIKISRWDDSSVYRLEKSADTSHRMLSKFSKQYDEKVLKLPIQTLLSRLNTNAASTKDGVATYGSPAEAKMFFLSTQFSEKYSGAQRCFPAAFSLFADVAKNADVFKRFATIARKKIVPPMLEIQRAAATSVQELGEAIIENSHAIRARPSEFSGVQKRRALLSLFNFLSKIGMDFHTTTYSAKQLELPFLMQERFPGRQIVCGSESPDASTIMQHLWTRADSYYYKNLSKMLTLRQSHAEHSRALSLAELRKLIGFSEHSFALLRAQRQALVQLQESQEKLLHLTQLADSELQIGAVPVPESLAAPIDFPCVNESVHMASELAMTLYSHVASLLPHCATLLENPELEKALHAASQRVEILASELQEVSGMLDRSSKTVVPWAILARFCGIAQRLCAVSDDCVHSVSSVLSSDLDFVAQWTQFVHQTGAALSSLVVQLLQPTLTSVDAADSTHAKLRVLAARVTKEVQLGVQQLLRDIEVAQAPPKEDDDTDRMKVDEKEKDEDAMETDAEPAPGPAAAEAEAADNDIEGPDVEINVISKAHTLAMSFAAASRVGSIVSALEDLHASCLDSLRDSSVSDSHKASLLAQLAVCVLSLAPVLHQFQAVLSSSLAGLLEHHASLSKFQYIMVSVFIGLCRDGYCGGSEEDGESAPQEGETLTGVEGTGLGEGQGEKDVSDKYEDEDQILGEKRDDEKQEEKEDGEKPPVRPHFSVLFPPLLTSCCRRSTATLESKWRMTSRETYVMLLRRKRTTMRSRSPKMKMRSLRIARWETLIPPRRKFLTRSSGTLTRKRTRPTTKKTSPKKNMKRTHLQRTIRRRKTPRWLQSPKMRASTRETTALKAKRRKTTLPMSSLKRTAKKKTKAPKRSTKTEKTNTRTITTSNPMEKTRKLNCLKI